VHNLKKCTHSLYNKQYKLCCIAAWTLDYNHSHSLWKLNKEKQIRLDRYWYQVSADTRQYQVVLVLTDTQFPLIQVLMSFVGSSAGRSSSSAELGISTVRPTQGYCSCWTVDQWWTAWPIYTGKVTTTWLRAWPRPWCDRCMIEQHSTTAVVNDGHDCAPSLPLDRSGWAGGRGVAGRRCGRHCTAHCTGYVIWCVSPFT